MNLVDANSYKIQSPIILDCIKNACYRGGDNHPISPLPVKLFYTCSDNSKFTMRR